MGIVVLLMTGVAHQSSVMLAPGITFGIERGPQRVVFDAIVAMVSFVLSAVDSCGEARLWCDYIGNAGQTGNQ